MIQIPIPFNGGGPALLARRLILAVQFLTLIPTPQVAGLKPNDLSRASVFFPLVGAVIGCCVAVAVMLGCRINPAVGGLAGLFAWVAITGGLHLDGLGDVADAFGAAHRNPERFHEVLHDPHAGSFAVIALTLQMAVKLVLIGSVAATGALWAFAVIPAWARWGAMFWSSAVPPLRTGTAERFSWNISMQSIAVWGLVLALVSAWIAPHLLAALAIVPAVAAFWRWRLGGITGDCLGASIEVTESLLLLALLI